MSFKNITNYLLVAFAIALLMNVKLTFAQMSGSSYRIDSDSINNMGNTSTSETYEAGDTGGETATGDSSSESYGLRAGFWQTANYNLSVTCPTSLLMGSIVGTGKSDPTMVNNEIICNIKTDNPGGYNLMWKASSTVMTNGSNTVDSYTPAVTGTPETWSVANTETEWGGRLGTGSTTPNTSLWGTADSYSSPAKWLNIPINDFILVTRPNATSSSGDDEEMYFGAEFGSSTSKASGIYSVDITITATAF